MNDKNLPQATCTLCPRKSRTALHLLAALLAVNLACGCAVVDTGAGVVKAGASVIGTTVGVATSVATSTVDVGLKAASTTSTVAAASVTAASGAKAVTVAAAGTAVAAGSLVINAAANAGQAKRVDDVSTLPVLAAGPDRFSAPDGRLWLTKNCSDVTPGQPALWVAMRSGATEVRSSDGGVCPVISSRLP